MEELIYPRCYHPKDLWKQIEIINQFIPVETNENFIKNAPDKIIKLERKKLADAIEKKRLLEEKLNNL